MNLTPNPQAEKTGEHGFVMGVDIHEGQMQHVWGERMVNGFMIFCKPEETCQDIPSPNPAGHAS